MRSGFFATPLPALSRAFLGALLGVVVAVIPAELPGAPHGGSYRGPADLLPPSAPAPTTLAPVKGDTGASGTSGGGTVAGPIAPGAPGRTSVRAGSVPRGIQIGEDFSKWQFWWEFNKDAYLLLKSSLHVNTLVAGSDEEFMGAARGRLGRISLPPSRADIDQRVVPTLMRALRETENRDITSACLVALAKVGRDAPKVELHELFAGYLKSHDQEIRETAALAMGISQRPAGVAKLLGLVLDDQLGRSLAGRSRVDPRTRAFAAYGLGLIAHANATVTVRSAILRALRAVLRDVTIVDRNIKVAAVNALGLFRADDKARRVIRRISDDAVRVLLEFYNTESGRGRDLLRAHVPPSVARILGRRDSPMARAFKKRLAAELRTENAPSESIQRSAGLALGQMAFSGEKLRADAWLSKTMQAHYDAGRDGQARYFSLVALAQIGGKNNREFLLRVLQHGNRTLDRPWAALALGCAEFAAQKTKKRDPVVAAALLAAFRAAGTPYARGAMAISLGLCGNTEAAPDLLRYLETHGHQDEFSGYVCVGLALMKHEKALQPIADVLGDSVRRPHRLRMAATALGMLGDRRLTARLISLMKERDQNLAKMAAVASALALIGDRASIDSLEPMLHDKSLPNLTRAFAAVALGGIADKEPVPWNAKIASNMNYRAAVETLVQSGAGILEIL